MFQLFFLFVTLANGLRTRPHMLLQVEPDQACQQWLASSDGTQFTECETNNPGIPTANDENNCTLTEAELDSYCENPCFDILTNAYQFFIETGTCLPVYEDKFKPCTNNTECPDLGTGPRVCYEGFCYMACNETEDCNSCNMETCDDLDGSRGCRSNMTEPIEGPALLFRTPQNTFRGVVYTLQAACSQNGNGVYCSQLLSDLNSSTTCDSLSEWGCCASTILPAIPFCGWMNWTDDNLVGLLNCTANQNGTGNTTINLNQTCNQLPPAAEFCRIVNITGNNGTENNASSSSSSSSSSSGLTGIISPSSSLTGIISSSSTGIGQTGNNGTDQGAAGKLSLSWTITLGLVFVAQFISST